MRTHPHDRMVFLIVLDSVGIGAAPDAADFGDAGANTLLHTAEAVGGLQLDFMRRLGLGNIPGLIRPGSEIRGVGPAEKPLAAFGALRERSRGKDTTTGHWEMAGLELEEGFRVFPAENSFPRELIAALENETGRRVIGNKAASGTEIIAELGERQLATGAWIVYTSADSVMQIAAHERVIAPGELYECCAKARRLCNPYRVGRVIARPFAGEPGSFARTAGRRDYSYPLPGETILDRLVASGCTVTGVGKIEDIYGGRGISKSFRTAGNAATGEKVIELADRRPGGLVFANLVDFDMLYGHRRDAPGYARALEQADDFLEKLSRRLRAEDLLIVTADHGNDPTFSGTDHTREYVPLLAAGPNLAGRSLGIRQGFYDVAQSLADYFGLAKWPRGASFLFGG